MSTQIQSTMGFSPATLARKPCGLIAEFFDAVGRRLERPGIGLEAHFH
jgi:hypothetical protein